MHLYLRNPQQADEKAYTEMMLEWETEGGKIHPGLLRRRGFSYAEWLEYIEQQRHRETCRPDRSPGELYFLCDAEGHLYGGGSTRFEEPIAIEIGHVAYGIRPSERRKGYGKLQLKLLMELCRKQGLQRMKVNCVKGNAASRALILSCGGVFEKEAFDDDGNLEEHYWIEIAEDRRFEAFAPLLCPSPHTLILGTFPSPLSRERFEYYGNPQNAFWRLLYAVYGEEHASPSYEEKKAFLARHHLAVWDVLAACRIQGAADSAIRDPVYNFTILQLLQDQPSITKLLFNGTMAQRFYRKGIQVQLVEGLREYLLPSTSPANAAHSFERKLAAWREALLV